MRLINILSCLEVEGLLITLQELLSTLADSVSTQKHIFDFSAASELGLYFFLISLGQCAVGQSYWSVSPVLWWSVWGEMTDSNSSACSRTVLKVESCFEFALDGFGDVVYLSRVCPH